ncbi:peptide ABC transporter ATP-binding protein [Haloferax namakaokahaiae]|uniref:Peptide ABC transporter ATP-binding protein n=1 Tax=Haloferax namakaokahaiae TaxID=1748331 RepID=A0ABD5ZGF2_9EURY
MPVVSTGDRLFVEVPTLGGALRVARHLDGDSLDEPSRLLRATGLTTELRVRGRTVVVVGTDAHSGVVARWLGLDPAEVRVGGVASAVGDAVRTTAGHLHSIVR